MRRWFTQRALSTRLEVLADGLLCPMTVRRRTHRCPQSWMQPGIVDDRPVVPASECARRRHPDAPDRGIPALVEFGQPPRAGRLLALDGARHPAALPRRLWAHVHGRAP